MKPPIGNQLLKRRTELGIKAVNVARSAGLHRQNYWRIESGKTKPNPYTLAKLCGALRLDPETLEPIDDKPVPSTDMLQVWKGDELHSGDTHPNVWVVESYAATLGLQCWWLNPNRENQL